MNEIITTSWDTPEECPASKSHNDEKGKSRNDPITNKISNGASGFEI